MLSQNINLNKRQNLMMELIAKNSIISVKELSQALDVSLVTIRKDIDILVKQDMVIKSHGDVRINKPDSAQSFFTESLNRNLEEKKAIAKVAASLITRNSIFCTDSSTTAYCISEYIPSGLFIKAITIQLMTAIRLSAIPDVEVIQTCGLVHPQLTSTTDYFTVNFLKQFKADIAFLSSNSFNMPAGAFDSFIYRMETKKMLTDISKQVVLLVDSTKFNIQGMCLSIPFSEIDTIITDEGAPKKVVEQIANSGKELYIAKISDGSVLAHYNPYIASTEKRRTEVAR